MRTDVLAVTIAQRLVLTAVHCQLVVLHHLQTFLTQRVGDIVERIGVERCRSRKTPAVAGVKADVRTERQRGHRVDGPLQIHIARPTVVALIALTDAVREGTARCPHKTLRPCPAPIVDIIVIPRHAPTHLQLVRLFVADVQCPRLRRTLSLSVAASPSAASAEVAVVHVVGVAHKRIAHVAKRFHGRQTDAIAAIRAVADVRISLQPLAGTTLGDEFQHEVVVAVVNTRQARQVALLVVSLYLVYHVRRQVLHHRTVVARHEVTPVHLKALHVLAVDADFAVIVNLRTRQSLNQRLDDRTLGHSVGIGIIHHRVVLDNHLLHRFGHHDLFQLTTRQRRVFRRFVLGSLSRQKKSETAENNQ